MKKKMLPTIENVTIAEVAAEGKAVARVDGVVLFVPFAVPGDVVNVQLTKKRSHFMEGYITQLVQPSPLRVQPFCEHYGTCGGCKWQPLPYPEQLKCKQQQVEDQLVRLGGFSDIKINNIIGSEKTRLYRNKLEFTFSHKRWRTREEMNVEGCHAERSEASQVGTPLPTCCEHEILRFAQNDNERSEPALGFHIPMKFDKVLDVKKCHLQEEPSNAIRLFIKNFAVANGYDFFNLREQTGLLRNLIIRTSSTGEVMVIVVFAKNDEEKISALMQNVQREFPQITALLYVINSKRNDTIGDQEIICYSGRDHIFEQMEGLRFKIGAKSFYQTNSEQAYRLYSVARDFAQLTGSEVVYDLYTGTGTIANFIAKNAKKVVGVEYVKEAIDDAWVNARLNGIENATFYAGDMKDVLNDDFIAQNGKPDVIILDPPRAGIHPDVAQTILRAAPQRIVYVSCNPATQARDLALMAEQYEITKVQPVDMFPHTHHVENVVAMKRR
ncbi:MAG: 23S rRNA (uracil(1939)-C(5))-methyltransferase RlmD [Prevotellaceae bacterium]|jgi:23S rRNA (uracil1939-C5)-methyltransferase|nr:23S rRNA (uracil(1939)-C(5))-methyltransferase RlmD [Prevotellaceae bacterium]